MNTQKLILLAVALVAGGGAFFLVMNNQQPIAQAPIEIVKPVEEKTVRVLVADQDFARGQRLTVDTMRWIKWPEKALSDSFITEESGVSAEDLSGAIARTLIVSGEPIIEAKIVRAGSSGLMAAVLQPGMRAVTLRVTPETATAGFILPGDRVDVIYAETNDDDDEMTVVQTILKDVRVLAIEANYSEVTETANLPGSYVTVELTPADAENFIGARFSQGETSLALRSIFEPESDPVSQQTSVEVIRYGQNF